MARTPAYDRGWNLAYTYISKGVDILAIISEADLVRSSKASSVEDDKTFVSHRCVLTYQGDANYNLVALDGRLIPDVVAEIMQSLLKGGAV